MNWNPFKRIADLERRVEEMHLEMMRMAAKHSLRLRMLEQHAKRVAEQK
jgi:hypothetical protein